MGFHLDVVDNLGDYSDEKEEIDCPSYRCLSRRAKKIAKEGVPDQPWDDMLPERCSQDANIDPVGEETKA